MSIYGVAPSDERVTGAVLKYVAECNGSISADGIASGEKHTSGLVRESSEIRRIER